MFAWCGPIAVGKTILMNKSQHAGAVNIDEWTSVNMDASWARESERLSEWE